MKTHFWLLGLWLGATVASAADKPIVYDSPNQTKEGAIIDQEANTALAGHYTIIKLDGSEKYEGPPKVTAGSLPPPPKNEYGTVIPGYVLIAYVVTAAGRAENPVVLQTTDKRLSSAALTSMEAWRFEPAKLDGKPIATAAVQEFNFQANTLRKGFVTDHIVLYQPNEVLERRLPGAEALAAYIKQLQDILTSTFAQDNVPETFQVVVAVRPGGKSRIWIISSPLESFHRSTEDILQTKLQEVKPVEVREGPIAFAICAGIVGDKAAKSETTDKTAPPIPKEWQEAVKNSSPPAVIPDGFLDIVWPDKNK